MAYRTVKYIIRAEFWGTNIIAVPLSINSGGRVPPSPPVIYAHGCRNATWTCMCGHTHDVNTRRPTYIPSVSVQGFSSHMGVEMWPFPFAVLSKFSEKIFTQMSCCVTRI